MTWSHLRRKVHSMSLIDCDLVTLNGNINLLLVQHWFIKWLVPCSTKKQYLNQYIFALNWTHRDKEWDFNLNTQIRFKKCFESMAYQMSSIPLTPICYQWQTMCPDFRLSSHLSSCSWNLYCAGSVLISSASGNKMDVESILIKTPKAGILFGTVVCDKTCSEIYISTRIYFTPKGNCIIKHHQISA